MPVDQSLKPTVSEPKSGNQGSEGVSTASSNAVGSTTAGQSGRVHQPDEGLSTRRPTAHFEKYNNKWRPGVASFPTQSDGNEEISDAVNTAKGSSEPAADLDHNFATNTAVTDDPPAPGAFHVDGPSGPQVHENSTVVIGGSVAEEQRGDIVAEAQLVEEGQTSAPIVAATEAPKENCWAKPRNQFMFVATIVVMAAVLGGVLGFALKGDDGGAGGATVNQTTASPTMPSLPTTTQPTTVSPSTPSPSTASVTPTSPPSPPSTASPTTGEPTPSPTPASSPQPTSFELLNGTWTKIGEDIAGESRGGRSGRSVSLSSDGTVLAIGAAISVDEDGNSPGHTRVYRRFGQIWQQWGLDIDGDITGDWSGWSVSLSGDGKTVAVGAPRNDGADGDVDSDRGHVRIFDQDSNVLQGWSQVGETLYGQASGDGFGYAVTLSKNGLVLAVGALRNDENGSDSGHVQVFRRRSLAGGPDDFVKVGDSIKGQNVGDRSGSSVAISADGSVVAVGAFYNDDGVRSSGGSNSGQVRVYSLEEQEQQWVQMGNPINGDVSGAQLGYSVDISADGMVVAVGANGNAGYVHTYKWDSSTWTRLGQELEGSDDNDDFGDSVSLSDDGRIIAIGADESSTGRQGYVRVFQFDADGNTWLPLGQELGGLADDAFGASVSLSTDGTTLAVGAPDNAGNVQVFELQ